MVNKALLGKIPLMIIALLFLIMPFNIYGAGETQIVPTWSQSSQQSEWSSKFRVTNFCESSNNPQNYSCQLTITVNGDYYGYVYFDGYINNQIIWDYQTMFISGGKGTFYYTWYANGLQQINKVNIAGLSLVSPTDNIDLSQIIQLLTSINSYEQQNNILLDELVDNTDTIENNQLTAITEIRNVLSQLVISNGYLDTLTKIRDWNVPYESIPFIEWQFNLGKTPLNYPNNYDRFNYPLFQGNAGDNIAYITTQNNPERNSVTLIIGTVYNVNYTNFTSLFDMDLSNFDVISYPLGLNYLGSYSLYINRFVITRKEGVSQTIGLSFKLKESTIYTPIYFQYSSIKTVSTDFALQFGLTNKLLDNLNVIANGTVQSNSAASSNDNANEQLQTESNTLFQQENGFKSDMQNAMQNVNNTFRLQDMGTKFVSSAQWVRTQYEQLTNNTPFASLITFSLITGLALILLGKVYK